MQATDSTPRVSVILPTHNRAHLVLRAAHSVLGQSFSDLELIIVNDASRDNTAEVLAQLRDPRVLVVHLTENRGLAGARNAGLEHARGKFIAFQDDDDEWLVEKLTRQVAVLEELGPGYVLIGCKVLRYMGDHVLIKQCWPAMSATPNDYEVDLPAFVRSFSAYVQSALFHASAVQAIHGFDRELKVCEEWDFVFRLLAHGKLAALKEPLILTHETIGGLSRRYDLRRDALNRLYPRHLQLVRQYPKAHAFFCYELAKCELRAGHARNALPHLLRGIRLNPAVARPYVLLGLVLLGGTVYRALERAVQMTKRRLAIDE